MWSLWGLQESQRVSTVPDTQKLSPQRELEHEEKHSPGKFSLLGRLMHTHCPIFVSVTVLSIVIYLSLGTSLPKWARATRRSGPAWTLPSVLQRPCRGDAHRAGWPDGPWPHWEDPWESEGSALLLCSASRSYFRFWLLRWQKVLTPKDNTRSCSSTLLPGHGCEDG